MGILGRVRNEDGALQDEDVEESFRVLSDMLGESPPEESEKLEGDAQTEPNQGLADVADAAFHVNSSVTDTNETTTDPRNIVEQSANPSPATRAQDHAGKVAEGSEINPAFGVEQDLSSEMLDVGDEVNTILRATRESASGLLRRAHREAQTLHDAAVERAKDLDNKTASDRVRLVEKSVDDAKSIKLEADQYAFELRNRTERDSRLIMDQAEEGTQQLRAYQKQLSQHLRDIERLLDASSGDTVSEEEVPVPGEPATELGS